jgi:polyisoprenoid-binding protein YceI
VKRPLAIAGAVALSLWTGLGLVAWSSVARRVTDTPSDESGAARATELAALADELGALHQDVRALASAMGTNLQTLNDALLASQDEHASALDLRLNALRDEVGSLTPSSSSRDELADLLRELGTLRDALRVSTVPGAPAQPVLPSAPALAPESSAPEVASAEEVAAPAPPAAPARERKSFLAFTLPSDDFRFDERRSWSVLPALSRIGFDARTTLHDFTATTSAIEGELEADLARPGEAPRARLTVQAAELDSGDAKRDAEMRERLAVEDHPALEFELTAFEPDEIDAAGLSASGRASGRMSVRGVTLDVVMPVRISIDDARRMSVEGQMKLDLTRFGVPVPNKLGLITMEKEVDVWIALKLRASARTEG